jgi:hypothetical protein
MKTKIYTQLMVLVGMVMAATPLAAHEFHDTEYYANSALYIMWHDMLHAIGAFVAQLSAVYVIGLMIQLSILLFIAIKIKRTRHAQSR